MPVTFSSKTKKHSKVFSPPAFTEKLIPDQAEDNKSRKGMLNQIKIK